MEIDVARVLGLVTRSVKNFDKDGKAASAVTLTRLYDTSVDDLWDAVTSKERIPRWFLPVEGELQLGGRYQLKDNAGGTITACTPPTHFAATWEFGGGKRYVEHAVYGADAGGTVKFWSFTSDGKRSEGQLGEAADIHPQALSFEAQMPAGTARMTYWPNEDGTVNWAVESKTKKGWNRFTLHHYQPQ